MFKKTKLLQTTYDTILQYYNCIISKRIQERN